MENRLGRIGPCALCWIATSALNRSVLKYNLQHGESINPTIFPSGRDVNKASRLSMLYGHCMRALSLYARFSIQ